MGGTGLEAGGGVWMAGTRLKSWKPAGLDGWHAAQELEARFVGWLAGGGGPRSLDGWHAALKLNCGLHNLQTADFPIPHRYDICNMFFEVGGRGR